MRPLSKFKTIKLVKITIWYIVLVLLFAATTNPSVAQNAKPDSTNIKDSTAQKKIDSTLTSISSSLEEIRKRLEKDSIDDKEPTGVIYFDTLLKVPVYIYNNGTKKHQKTGRTVMVDRMTLLVRDGYIIDVQVHTTNKNVFTNTRSPITLNGNYLSKTTRRLDYLRSTRNGEESIILQDVLFYDPWTTFYPEDHFYVLDRTKPRDTLSKNVGLNTVLDLRLYTDALGALGGEPNGIILTDVRMKQFFHRLHYPNSNKRTFNYVKITFNASKLDSKFAFVDSTDELSRTQLMQRAKINGEVVFNLFSTWLNKKTINDWYIDAGAGFHTTNLAKSKDTIPITTQTIFFEAGVNLRNSSNIGFDMYTRFIIQYSPQTDFAGQNKATQFLRTGGEVYWNPFKNVANRLFARINYTMGLKKSEGKNSYSQVQFGYSLLLSRVIGLK